MSEEYVFEGITVRVTGRTAKRDIVGRRGTTQVVIHEIQPASPTDGAWKKWVARNELYLITENEHNNDK